MSRVNHFTSSQLFCSLFQQAQPWLVCLSAGLFFFYDFMLMNMFNSINSSIRVEFGLNALQLSRLSSLYPMSTVLLLLVSGLMLDRFSTRRIILTAMFLCIASTLLFSQSETLWQAAVTRAIAGSTAAFCFLSCIMLASRWFESSKLAAITGLIVTMAMFGGSVSQAPLKYLVIEYGWRSALMQLGLIGIVFFVAMYFLIQDYPKNASPAMTQHSTKEPILQSLSLALSNPQNWICGMYISLMNLVICVFGGLWGQEFIKSVYGINEMAASEITTMIFIGTMIGSPLVGWLSDHMQTRKQPMIYGAIASIVLTLCLLTLHQPSYWMLNAIFFLLGLSTSTQVIGYPVIFEGNDPKVTGVCESFASVLIMSGVALFPIMYGYTLDSLSTNGVYTKAMHLQAFLVLPISLMISAALAFLIRETYDQTQ